MRQFRRKFVGWKKEVWKEVRMELDQHIAILRERTYGIPLLPPVKVPPIDHMGVIVSWGDFSLQDHQVGFGAWARLNGQRKVLYTHMVLPQTTISTGAGEALTLYLAISLANMLEKGAREHVSITDSAAAAHKLENGKFGVRQMEAASKLWSNEEKKMKIPSFVLKRPREYCQGADLLSKGSAESRAKFIKLMDARGWEAEYVSMEHRAEAMSTVICIGTGTK